VDIRTKVAKELGWNPVQELLEEIHEGDPRMGSGWPFNYSSLEPLNKRRLDWRLRYAAAFHLVPSAEGCENPGKFGIVENVRCDSAKPGVAAAALSENKSTRVSDAR
jgi:hypothetical protein